MAKGFLGAKLFKRKASRRRSAVHLDRTRRILKELPELAEKRQYNVQARRDLLEAQSMRDHRVELQNIESSLLHLPPEMQRAEMQLRKGVLQRQTTEVKPRARVKKQNKPKSTIRHHHGKVQASPTDGARREEAKAQKQRQ